MKLFLCLLCCFLAFLLANPEKTEERCMFKADAGPCNAKITMFAHDPFEAGAHLKLPSLCLSMSCLSVWAN
ncbi:uncharacterized protein LOC132787828 isoform X4 [Drosophila nasuta]|uniref:uncharacterized protein LOC132787828 isoform X4 n=1 Tax=Drosophila nasuta TaxID=42062 RepID=UPI00295F58E3|nr:uncharacterized protein LOC132787828 isoform X4 [Drosophila nasuta]